MNFRHSFALKVTTDMRGASMMKDVAKLLSDKEQAFYRFHLALT